MVVEHDRLGGYWWLWNMTDWVVTGGCEALQIGWLLVVVEHDRLGGYWWVWSITDWVVTGGCGA